MIMGFLDVRGNVAFLGILVFGGVWKGLDGLDIGFLSWSRFFRVVFRVTVFLRVVYSEF